MTKNKLLKAYRHRVWDLLESFDALNLQVVPHKMNKEADQMATLVRKKNGEIRLCVDFRDLNKASLKDNYPLSSMEQILQIVAGTQRFSMLDGYSGFNQILVKEEDQFKTAFTTKWGTYAYQKMPFGLSNAGTTFQRAMDIAFKGYINEFILGKLLGHVVSKDGITIDPERVSAILALFLLAHKKAIQSFLSNINFVRRFIPNFVGLVRPITLMLKKDITFRWIAEGKESFNKIKQEIAFAPTLINLNYSKDFILYAYGTDASVVPTQENEQGLEQPVAFFSQTLKDYELRYSHTEKHVYAIMRSLKKFKSMLSTNHMKVLVSHSSVRDFIMGAKISEKRARWVTKIMEYDVTIKAIKLNINPGAREWMKDMITFRFEGAYPPGLNKAKRRHLRLQFLPYVLIGGLNFTKNLDGALLRCINDAQIEKVLAEFHDGFSGGHFSAKTPTMKIIMFLLPLILNKLDLKAADCDFAYGLRFQGKILRHQASNKEMDSKQRYEMIQVTLKEKRMTESEYLNWKPVVKVADFGVARFLTQNDGTMTAETGTYRWMAPEVINHQPYDQKADVFSFAIVLWELLTAKLPYDSLTPLQAALGVRQGLRPPIPENTHPKVAAILEKCWHENPTKRPNFSEITTMLERILKQVDNT
ncbi:hypothetical protein KI387_018673, partial [Taxus chinensis]